MLICVVHSIALLLCCFVALIAVTFTFDCIWKIWFVLKSPKTMDRSTFHHHFKPIAFTSKSCVLKRVIDMLDYEHLEKGDVNGT